MVKKKRATKKKVANRVSTKKSPVKKTTTAEVEEMPVPEIQVEPYSVWNEMDAVELPDEEKVTVPEEIDAQVVPQTAVSELEAQFDEGGQRLRRSAVTAASVSSGTSYANLLRKSIQRPGDAVKIIVKRRASLDAVLKAARQLNVRVGATGFNPDQGPDVLVRRIVR